MQHVVMLKHVIALGQHRAIAMSKHVVELGQHSAIVMSKQNKFYVCQSGQLIKK